MNSYSNIQSFFNVEETEKPLFQKIVFILLSYILSMLIMLFVHPELLINHNLSFMWQHDLEIPFENVFTLVSHFYHGGIQLWNPYDQMSYGYSHLTVGLYTLANVLTAAVYILLAPLFSYQGEAFHHVHALGFYSIAAFIRTLGAYLLILRFTRNSVIILISLVCFNTILSSPMYMGLVTNNLYSYLPLLLYFILRFFDDFRLNDFLCVLTVLTLCIANSPFVGLSYFYLTVHFFIVVSIILVILLKIIQVVRNKKLSLHLRIPTMDKQQFIRLTKICGILIVCLLIMLPSLIMAKSLKSDFFISDSGLGETKGRLKNVFSISKYFNEEGRSSAVANKFLNKSLDFYDNQWSISWVFLGGFVFHFAWLGLLLSRNLRKHIFLWTIILIILVNAPRQAMLWTSAAHWINVLSNPFSFLLRSFHMSALLIPFYVLPLAVTGFQAIDDFLKEKYDRVYSNRIIHCLIICIVLFIYFASSTVYPTKQYGMITLLPIFCLLLLFLRIQYPTAFTKSPINIKKLQGGCFIILALLFILDHCSLSYYIRHDQYSRNKIEPEDFESLNLKSAILDYQNPAILPVRKYFRFQESVIEPRIYSKQNNFGLFYEYVPMDRNMLPLSLYSPIHFVYREMYEDENIQDYFDKNNQMIFLSDYAIESSLSVMPLILSKNLQNKVVVIEEQDNTLPKVINNISNIKPKDRRSEQLKKYQYQFQFKDALIRKKDKYMEYSFKLPEDFPEYLSSTVFTKDKALWKLYLQGSHFYIMQGKLTYPFQFDVQNIKKGRLFLSLPLDFEPQEDGIVLEILKSSDIVDIWQNDYDNFGFIYNAYTDGWLVMHYPYDEKWKLSIDGQEKNIYRVNKYFIGTPITQGEHNVLLQYWPNSPLRCLIGLSVLLIIVCFFSIVYRGLRLETQGTEGT